MSLKTSAAVSPKVQIRAAVNTDLDALVTLENTSFANDRLSRRRLQHWLKAPQRVLLVAETDSGVLGYGLVLLRKGTRLARLYSLAVSAQARGLGLGRQLLAALEAETAEQGKFFMRLEVAEHNQAAIGLYQAAGYKIFGTLDNYYEDHQAALRMQKRIWPAPGKGQLPQVQWYSQTTEFTCGPAALMMAFNQLGSDLLPDQALELDLWREATTIFMTSGHGGCHPVGLALAAKARGYAAQVYLSNLDTPFIDGVRSEKKKDVLRLVDDQFKQRAEQMGVEVHQGELSLALIHAWLAQGHTLLALISTYRMDGKKAPHWVLVTAADDDCLYVHDPDLDEKEQEPLDCQHIPIAAEDFASMSAFGKQRFRAAILLAKSA